MQEELKEQGYEFAANLNVVNFESEGLYMFNVPLPDSLVSVDVARISLYAQKQDEINSSSNVHPTIINEVVTAGEVKAIVKKMGVDPNSPGGTLSILFLSHTGGSVMLWATRLIFALLGIPGCNTNPVSFVGIGLTGFIILAGFSTIRLFKKQK